METPSDAPKDVLPSPSSPSSPRLAWWRAPEPVIAVIGAIFLRFHDKLGQSEFTTIMMIALGVPLTIGATQALAQLRSRAK